MAVKTLYFKENEGMALNPTGQFSSSVPSMAWWTSFGSQSNYGEPSDLFKHDQFINIKQTKLTTEPALDKGNTTTHFTIFPDDRKSSNDGQKSLQKTISLQTSSPEYHAHIDLGFSPSMICAKYPPDQCYSLFSTYGSQVSERVMLPMATDDGPIFVNPKQYHGIMRRRKSRAKAVLENRPTQKRKPFMHLSRHLHAMRRPRGTGGRFLNSKSSNDRNGGKDVAKGYDMQPHQPTGSQSSEVLQSSNSGTLNSSKEGNSGGSNHSVTEVTSLYSRRDLDHFSINHLAPPIHNFSVMMSTGHSIVMPSKWVATADNCYNLNV